MVIELNAPVISKEIHVCKEVPICSVNFPLPILSLTYSNGLLSAPIQGECNKSCFVKDPDQTKKKNCYNLGSYVLGLSYIAKQKLRKK